MAGYNDLVLLGHSLADYKEMFRLNEIELKNKILNCHSGANSFNAELTSQGGQVTSCDPLYAKPLSDIAEIIEQKLQNMLNNIKSHHDRFNWQSYHSLDELALVHKKNIEKFLKDYELGKRESRYNPCELPKLPYHHFEFDLAVCSYYFFGCCPNQSLDYHLQAIQSLTQVAKEVRIFPLLNSLGEIPELVGPLMLTLQQQNFGVEIKAVPYSFQKKGNAMLRIFAQTCDVSST